MANLKDVIYISNEDYQTLVSTGTVVIGTETLTYDENNLYLTPETIVTDASFLFSNSNWVSSININQFNSIKDSNIIYVLDDENITHYFVKGESNLEYNSQNNRWEGYINYLATDYSDCTDLHLTWNSSQENYTVAINSYNRVKSVNNISADVNGNISVAIGGGTVTSVRVQAGTGLSSSQSTAQTSTLDTTISIADGYKLPTTIEWNSKGTYSKPSGGIPASDLAESYYLSSNPSGYQTESDVTTLINLLDVNEFNIYNVDSGSGLVTLYKLKQVDGKIAAGTSSINTIATSSYVQNYVSSQVSSAGDAVADKIVSRHANGSIQTEKLAISSDTTTKATIQYNSTDDCIEFIFS